MKKKIYKFLLIEDSNFDVHFIQRIFFEILGTSGFTLTHSPLLKSAIEILEGNCKNFDLIISDLSLPDGIDPEKNIELIHKHANQIPILVVSGFYDQDLFIKIKAYNVIDYFIKGEMSLDLFKALLFKDLIKNKQQKILKQNKKKGRKRVLLLNINKDIALIFKSLCQDKNLGLKNYLHIDFFVAFSKKSFNNYLSKDFYQLIFIDLEKISDIWLTQTLNNYKKKFNVEGFSEIVVISSSTMEEVKKNYKALIWDFFLNKPFQNLEYLSSFLKERLQ